MLQLGRWRERLGPKWRERTIAVLESPTCRRLPTIAGSALGNGSNVPSQRWLRLAMTLGANSARSPSALLGVMSLRKERAARRLVRADGANHQKRLRKKLIMVKKTAIDKKNSPAVTNGSNLV
jgi:hypothetical protein